MALETDGATHTSVSSVTAGPHCVGRSKRITATVGTTAYVISPATGTWKYLKVTNLSDTSWVSIGINEAPVVAPAANPGVAADWEAGYDVGPGESEVIPLFGTLTNIQLLALEASTDVILNLVK